MITAQKIKPKDLEANRIVTGKTLLILRNKIGIPKYVIAKLSGLSELTINNIETGSANYCIDSYFIYHQSLNKLINNNDWKKFIISKNGQVWYYNTKKEVHYNLHISLNHIDVAIAGGKPTKQGYIIKLNDKFNKYYCR